MYTYINISPGPSGSLAPPPPAMRNYIQGVKPLTLMYVYIYICVCKCI